MSENPRPPEESGDHSGLAALLELREFLASELDPTVGQDQMQRTFQPITDGLGLESPVNPKPKPKVAAPAPTSPKVTATPRLIVDDLIAETPPEPPSRRLNAERPALDYRQPRPRPTATPSLERPPLETRRSISETLSEEEGLDLEGPEALEEMPRASLIKRVLAGIIDEAFVLTVCFLALVLTLNFLTGAVPNFGPATLKQIQSPLFQRFAILEFATIWVGYFAICVGVLDMTFGMWVWGLRLHYGASSESMLIKKVLRIVLSFFFYAPIAPLVLLMFQRRGRNLLDWLTGTSLHRTML